MNRICLYIACLMLGASVCNAQIIVKSNDPHVHYMGRIIVNNDNTQLQWSGTSVKFNFNGTSVIALLKDEHGGNFFNVIVDDKMIKVIHPDTAKKEYVLAENLEPGNHSIELFKRTEAESGKTRLYRFLLNKGSHILPAPATKKHKIEFYGNSITCGMQIGDTTIKGPGGDENNYMAYGALTARHFDAEYQCIARSGIGIMVSWFPLIMPEMYNRLDETDPSSQWDFSKYTPDLVVINLGQNDSWILKQPQNGQFKARFGSAAPTEEQIVKAYSDFVKTIKSKYPKAKIICALGNMDATQTGSPWPGYIEKAVGQLNDKNIYSVIFPYKNTPNHPTIKEHQQMADQLIAFIEKNIKW